MKHLIAALSLVAAAATAHATPFKLEFSASQFANGGVAAPGFEGPWSGSFSWDANSVNDPITAFTAFDLTIAGHHYTLGEVGIANNGSTQTALGALVRGANAVVGDGAFDDFLIVFDRTLPQISAFAYSIGGKSGSIWWSPAQSEAHYAAQAVSAPASVALAGLGLLACAGISRRRGVVAA